MTFLHIYFLYLLCHPIECGEEWASTWKNYWRFVWCCSLPSRLHHLHLCILHQTFSSPVGGFFFTALLSISEPSASVLDLGFAVAGSLILKKKFRPIFLPTLPHKTDEIEKFPLYIVTLEPWTPCASTNELRIDMVTNGGSMGGGGAHWCSPSEATNYSDGQTDTHSEPCNIYVRYWLSHGLRSLLRSIQDFDCDSQFWNFSEDEVFKNVQRVIDLNADETLNRSQSDMNSFLVELL